MTSRRRILHGLIFASVIALPLAQGCGGDDAAVNQTSTDGGDTDSTTTTGGDSSTPTDGSTTIPDSSAGDPFCAATADYDTRCSLTDACDTARLANCSADEAIASTNATAAYAACEAQEPCPAGSVVTADAGAEKAYESCLSTHFGTPDSALTGLVIAYCGKCGNPANPAACEEGDVARGVAIYDDAILTEIQSNCLPSDAGADDGGPTGECARFGDCARAVVVSHDPQPAACNDE